MALNLAEISAMGGEGSTDARERLEIEYREARRLYDELELVGAKRAANEFVARWIEEPDLPLNSRELLADAMWIGCNSAAAESWDSTGVTSAAAIKGMNELIAWLRRQPEQEFRRIEVERLSERMRWYGSRIRAVDALEEVAEAVTDLDDPAVTKEACMRVDRHLPWLLKIPEADHARYVEATAEALAEGEDRLDADEMGVTDDAVARMERVAEALSDLRDCLEVDDDQDASRLYARLLLAELELAAKLGLPDRSEALFERFAALGEAALAACDSQIERVRDAQDDGNDRSAAIPVMLITKANVLMVNDEDDAALGVLAELIELYGAEDHPAVAAVVEAARELQTDLLDESDDEIA